ncbi:hypothetical protein [Burkholderia seminalis]|uniref:hypothetical protein n=1 Tax=Burkholderia seminalis TaxID=488731 RepID=UPI001904E4EE|nr:hypothetical protein [Burkholderia seminalis]MBJ9964790.1 hypothetical protein [Burkholderia seminalis]
MNETIPLLSGVNRRDETPLPIVSRSDIQTALYKPIQSHILPTHRVIISAEFSIPNYKIAKHH